MIALPVLQCVFQSGATVYAVLRNRLNGQVWNTSTPAFETYNEAHWAQYAIALTEQTSSGYYTANAPSGVSGYLVSAAFYQQAGGSPATSDSPPFQLANANGENVAAISGDPVNAPSNLQAVLASQTQASVAAGAITASSFPTSLVDSNAGAYQGRVIYFTSGVCLGMAALIANYTPTGGIITLSGSLAAAPSASDTFIIA